MLFAGLAVVGTRHSGGITRHAVLRNYPAGLAHIRFHPGRHPAGDPTVLSRKRHGRHAVQPRQRSLVYQRAKRPAGQTSRSAPRIDVYADVFEWLHHSIAPKARRQGAVPRTLIGGPHCSKPYSASIFNISAMSFGPLSAERDPRPEHRCPAGQLCP